MTIDSVAYLMTYKLHVLEVYVYGANNAVLYCTDSTLQQLRVVCAATARLLYFIKLYNLGKKFSSSACASWVSGRASGYSTHKPNFE